MTLYLGHFGLREAPFKITPAADFFYHGGKRGDILQALLYAVKVGEGIMMVTGEVGSGKTMILRTMAERLPGEADLIYIANPSLSGREILFHICEELELQISDDRHDTVRRLQNYLVERHAEGRRVVAFIDEAQAMPDESLEEIRLLSNLETSREKLLQIILFGQPELDDKLSRQNMRQLRERITVAFKLEPLSRADVREYITTRLRAAGYEGGPLFSDEACGIIYGISQGLSRRINVLADKAMLSAYERGALAVSAADAKRAADDVRFSKMQYRSERAKSASRRLAFGLAAAAVAMLAIAVGVRWQQNTPTPTHPSSPVDSVDSVETVAAVQQQNIPETNPDSEGASVVDESGYDSGYDPEPETESELNLNSDSDSVSESESELNSEEDANGVFTESAAAAEAVVINEGAEVAALAPPPQVATVVERIIERVTIVQERVTVERILQEDYPPSDDPAQTRREMLAVIQSGGGAETSGEDLARELTSLAESHQDAPRESGTDKAEWKTAAARAPGARNKSGDIGDNPQWSWMPANSYLRARLNATQTWLTERTPRNDRRHTARLLTVGQERAVFLERFLRHLADFYPIRNLMVYPTRLNSGDKFVVTFGVYPSRGEANIYIANLPYYFTGGRPFAQPLGESAREAGDLW